MCDISTTCQRLVILLFAVRGTANRRKEATKMARSLTWKNPWEKVRVRERESEKWRKISPSSFSLLLFLLPNPNYYSATPSSSQVRVPDSSNSNLSNNIVYIEEGIRSGNLWVGKAGSIMGSNRENTVVGAKREETIKENGWGGGCWLYNCHRVSLLWWFQKNLEKMNPDAFLHSSALGCKLDRPGPSYFHKIFLKFHAKGIFCGSSLWYFERTLHRPKKVFCGVWEGCASPTKS